MTTRVLVVDDTAVFRRIVSDALTGLPDVEVVGTAVNGKMALSRIQALRPDLVTLDIEMPEMNGIEVLERLSADGSTAGVIVLSAVTVQGGRLTVRALELGAFDFLTKPDGGTQDRNLEQLRSNLAPMVRAFRRQREVRAILGRPVVGTVARPPILAPAKLAVPVVTPRVLRDGPPLVLIGVSTGGPAALARLLPSLPADLGAPVLIVQHMPPLFTEPLAASLAKKCALPVTEARDGEAAEPNHIYLAPGGRQMKLVRGPRGEVITRITDDPPENNCRPAVDYLFRSAALYFPGRSVAAILTGMGSDGTLGLQLLKRAGCFAIAQDEATSVVFGMPREAIRAGVVDQVAPLDEIALALTRKVRETL